MFPVRPKSDETEEDLLKFQQEFLSSGLKPAATVIRKRKNSSQKEGVEKDVSEMETSQDDHVELDESGNLKRTRFQKQKYYSKDSTEEDMEEEMEKHDTHIVTVLSKIMERDTSQTSIVYPSLRSVAFPSVFHRNPQAKKCEQSSARNKKSIFAQQFNDKSLKDFGILPPSESAKLDSSHFVEPCHLKVLKPGIPLEELQNIFPSPNVVTGEGLSGGVSNEFAVKESRKIHEESLQKLSMMDEAEVLAEKQKLLQELNPTLVKLLQNRQGSGTKQKLTEEKFLEDLSKSIRSMQSPEETVAGIDSDVSLGEESSVSGGPKDIPIKVEGRWLHMDKVESEKLSWMSAIPKHRRKEIELSLRFDFNSNIIACDEDVPTHLGLHHHGDEPDNPGYTLQELFILSRSNFTQQRVFAVNMIGKIITKAKQGEYASEKCDPVLEILVNSGVLFLLRWSLDEQSETFIKASVFAMHSLIVPQSSEGLLENAFSSSRGCEILSLRPIVEKNLNVEENDFEIVQKDVIAGFLKMDLLQRLRYILEVCHPPAVTVNHCLDILIRICQHSIKSAVAVFECPRLIDYIMKNLLQTASSLQVDKKIEESSLLHQKTVRLLRAMCTAGRHLTSRMLNKYDKIETLISTFIIQQHNPEITNIIIGTELEVWRFWIACCSYGFLCNLYRDVYAVVVGHIQKFTTSLSQLIESSTDEELLEQISQRCQLVFLLCSAVLNASIENKNFQSWSEMGELTSIISSTLSVCMRALRIACNENPKLCSELKKVISTGLEFISTFYERLRGQPDYDVMQQSDTTIKLTETILLPVFENICQIKITENDVSTKREILPALPELSVTSNCRNINYYQLFSSLLRSCVVLSKFNKECCGLFQPVISNIEKNCRWMLSLNNDNSFFMRSRTYCLYWAAQLYTLIATSCGDQVCQHGTFFHLIAFRCFSQLQSGDEHLCHHLLSTVLFHPTLFSDISEETKHVTNTMATLVVAPPLPHSMQRDKDVAASFNNQKDAVLNVVVSNLPSLRSTYLTSFNINANVLKESKIRFLQKANEIQTFLLHPYSGPCAPSDWPYIPLLQLYNRCMDRIELPPSSTSHILHCLYYLCFLESHCSEYLSLATPTAKLVRLMCVFLAGNDLFLDERVKHCLVFLFHHYCNVESQNLLDFSKEIPGISSFYDFYISLLEQYEGVSYGDHLFSSVLLLPLNQYNHGFTDVKKAFWCEHREVVRILNLHIRELLIPASWFLNPSEKDIFIIRSYVSALASDICSSPRCPVPYLIAIHHTAQFLFSDEVNATLELKKEIYRSVMKIGKLQVRTHILQYISPDPDPESQLGFLYDEKMQQHRAYVINKLTN